MTNVNKNSSLRDTLHQIGKVEQDGNLRGMGFSTAESAQITTEEAAPVVLTDLEDSVRLPKAARAKAKGKNTEDTERITFPHHKD